MMIEPISPECEKCPLRAELVEAVNLLRGVYSGWLYPIATAFLARYDKERSK